MNTDVDVPTDLEMSSPALHLDEQDLNQLLFSLKLPDAQLQQLSPAALAYLGDAVYELHVRLSYLVPPKRIQTYHQQVVAQVRAEAQAHHLEILIPQLTPDELELLRRGRNAAVHRSKRIEPHIYQQASSLETLVGYLYLTNPQRLSHLLALLDLVPVTES